ncbi:MAG: hypothetical protein J6B06_05830 [Lachnospiraceae bacterium]|nr:hypothetical protein [Lachnospiraceae bacterium]
MRQLKALKKIFKTTVIISLTSLILNGCVYVNNDSWSDLTPEEPSQVQQAVEDVREVFSEVSRGN